MDRRLRYYFVKSQSSPKKKAAQWLRKHPMECVVLAASKARVDTDEEESSDDDDEDAERNTPNDEGALLETEKEVLRNVQLTDLLADLRANPRDEEDTAGYDNGDQIVDADDDNETTHALKKSLAQTLPGSLDNRHLSLLLEKRYSKTKRGCGGRYNGTRDDINSVSDRRTSPKKIYVCYSTIQTSPFPHRKEMIWPFTNR